MSFSRVAATSLLFGTLTALSFVSPQAASAQGGLADALGDPTGQTPYTPPAADVGTGAPVYSEVPDPPSNTVPAPPGLAPVPRAPGAAVEPISASIATRLRVLDATFQILATRGGPDYLGSVLSLLAGAAEIVFGALFIDTGAPFDVLAPYLIALGSATIVRTVLVDFILRPDPRSPAIAYQHMPSGTHAQRLARLEYGERQLESLAEQFLIARIVDASVNIAAALAVIPAYLIPRDWMIVNELEAFIFVGPAISLIGAIVTLATPSPAEQRRDAYRQMRQRLEGDEDDAATLAPPGPTFHVGFSVDPRGGGFGMLSGAF